MALAAKFLKNIEEPAGIRCGQACRRFIEDNDRSVRGQARAMATRDLSALLSSETYRSGSRWEATVCNASAALSRTCRQEMNPPVRPKPVPRAMFSAIVMVSTRPRSWWMKAMFAVASGVPNACPATVIWPLVGEYSPERILISVDLPAPFWPSSAWMLPASRVRLTSCRAALTPNRLDRCSIWISGSAGGGLSPMFAPCSPSAA
ncbi:hypothetical protein AHiyo1_41970 [Arthrobacter sp. Hiyo1]|nr:hypothetical protein AHiyo1_41970 [Arthrobacter sp. Hiyo1]